MRSFRLLSTSARAAAASVQPPIQTYSLAGKYASAAYSAALSKSEAALKAVESDLSAIGQSLEKDAKIREHISNPTLSPAEKQKGVQQLLKVAKNGGDEITKNVFAVLADNGRLQETDKVIEEFQAIMSAHRGEVNITVTSAAPLDAATQSRLDKILKDSDVAKTGKSTKVTNVVNPAILGGLIVDFGGKSIDLSVQARVQKLNALLQESI